MLYAGCVNLKNLPNLNFNKMMMMMMMMMIFFAIMMKTVASRLQNIFILGPEYKDDAIFMTKMTKISQNR